MRALDPHSSAAALLRGLRKQGGERQFTQAIAAVARADPAFASAFVQLALDTALRDVRHTTNVRLMGKAPSALECVAEPGARGKDGEHLGYVDLRFDGGDDFTLFVENKLGAGFGHRQLERYQTALHQLPPGRTRAGLIAITRDIPLRGELESGDDGWLGAIRWARLYDAGLATLPVVDDDLRRQWEVFIEIMHTDGDLGITKVDPDLMRAWARYEEAKSHVRSLLDSVRERSLERLRELLKEKKWPGPKAEVAAQYLTRSSPVNVLSGSSAWTGFQVPAYLLEHSVRLEFWPDDGGEIAFGVEAIPWHGRGRMLEKERQLAVAARKLALAGFQATGDRDGYMFWSEHKQREFLGDDNVPDRLIEIIDKDLAAIVDSGILNGNLKAPRKQSRRQSKR